MNKFVPRLTAPEKDSIYYYSNKNLFHKYGFGMPNCTCYAWGRFFELNGKPPTLSTNDAERWFGFVSDGYERGLAPKLGAVACWAKGSSDTDADGSGHVAIVEEISENGFINTSNSAYGGQEFYMKYIAPPYTLSGYTFQGFIYNPTEFSLRTFPLWLLFKFNDWRLKR